MLQNKETTVQRYQKILNQNTKKNPGIEVALFNFTGDMGIDNSGCLTSSFSFFFLFCNEPAKRKYYAMCPYSWSSSFPQTSQCTFNLTIRPPPSVRTLWITPMLGSCTSLTKWLRDTFSWFSLSMIRVCCVVCDIMLLCKRCKILWI